MPIDRALTALLALTLITAGSRVLAQPQTQTEAQAPAPAETQAAEKAPGTEERNTDADFWRLVASPYTFHYSSDPDHEPVYAIGLEWQRSDRWYFGATYFSNSFGQPSGYLYVGQRYGNLFSIEQLFAQWSVGLLYGYKEPYEDKVPFNSNGFSPGAVLSLGWQFTRQFSSQLNFLGTAALQVQFSFDFR